MTKSRTLAPAVFGCGTVLLIMWAFSASVAWLDETYFYWKHGWNFALPPPGQHPTALFGSEFQGSIGRLALDWPLNVLTYAGLAHLAWHLRRETMRAAPADAPPPPESPSQRWLAAGMIVLALILYAVALTLLAANRPTWQTDS